MENTSYTALKPIGTGMTSPAGTASTVEAVTVPLQFSEKVSPSSTYSNVLSFRPFH
jgi:hypothetical protein